MSFEKTNRTELTELGEFGLIKYVTKNIILANKESEVGVGDDAAVLNPLNQRVLVTTDMLVEGVHFDLMYAPLKHLGYKAVMVNLSDICAMNAIPKQITMSLGLSNRFSVEAIEEFYEGVYLACSKHGIDLIGGDTTTSKSGLLVSVTAIGYAEENEIVQRSTAKDNDLIVVTGDLGGAYVGLQLLEREKQVYLANPKIQPDLEGNDYILERQLKPEARYDIVKLLKELEVKPTSMIDISDGLSSELIHICESSKVGCNLYEEKIPIDPTTISMASEFNLDPTVCALSGGEDYELLFTIDLADYDKIKGNPNFSVIGHITNAAQGRNLIARSGAQYPLTAQGWNALEQENKTE